MIDRRLISAEITRIESREKASFKKLSKVFGNHSFQKTICFTGPGGVGKSTLISRLVPLVSSKKSLAWLACDPSSPISGGSVLGDRIRLGGAQVGEEVFIRSLSTRGSQAFSRAIQDVEIFMESFFDEVWVETAGSGQTQVEISNISAITILVLQPETGDEIQWMKSGLRECVDLFVINKSDLGGAESMMQSLLELGAREEQVLTVSAKDQKGLNAILTAIQEVREQISWKKKVKALQESLSLSLYREIQLLKMDKKYKKESAKWRKNPYLALLKEI